MTVQSISLAEKHAAFSEYWSPKRIARLDDYELKLAKGSGRFDWHKHDNEDEMFLVTQGELVIEIEHQDPITLGPGELCVIPKGVRHRPIAETGDVHILLIERAGVVNTGDNADSDLRQEIVDL